jgi:hypothetical protein
MRQTTQTDKKAEARVLGLAALLCYSVTLAGMFVFGYTVLTLTLRSASLCDYAVYSSPCF